jgi:hypothetical protein
MRDYMAGGSGHRITLNKLYMVLIWKLGRCYAIYCNFAPHTCKCVHTCLRVETYIIRLPTFSYVYIYIYIGMHNGSYAPTEESCVGASSVKPRILSLTEGFET